MPHTIFRLISEQAWLAAERSGSFRGSAHDVRDGFIHFSTAEQLAETAAKHYAGQSNLLLLYVKTAALSSALKWEVSRNEQLFPHLYGLLPTSAVYRVTKLALGPDGKHIFPSDLGQ